jgi:tripartite-type tricarboxylate transporter receptor subunit TctC
MRRFTAYASLVIAVCFAFPASVQAQGEATKNISLILPYNPGGLPDVLARVIAQKFTENTGRQVIIENRAGGSGIIGVQNFLSRALPDGNTLFLLDDNTGAINVAASPNLPYDPQRDFAPVAQAIRGYVYLVANAKSGFTSLGEMIAQAKEKPGAINFGSPGTASLHHLGMERLARLAGVKMTHVPYRGTAQATTDLLRGDISVMFATLTSVSQHVERGDLRLLAVAAPEAPAQTPGVPTVASLGYPGFVASTTMGFAAKAGTPEPVVKLLNEQLNNAINAPDVRSKIEALGVEVFTGPPAQLGSQLEKDRAMYTQIVKDIGFKIN